MEGATNVGSLYGDLFVPFIRTKRAHSKSRLGCTTCKQRRVKCDESRPRCTKCCIRNLACSYANKATTPRSVRTSADLSYHTSPSTASDPRTSLDSLVSSQTTTPLSCSDVSHGSSPPEHLPTPAPVQDFELAQHFFEVVSHSFSRSSTRGEQFWIWHVFIPGVAYVSETVRHALLTLGAISLHFQQQRMEQQLNSSHQLQTSSPYLDAAEKHGNVFVEQSRSQLAALLFSDANVNMASTRLLCVLAFAFFRHYRQIGENVGSHRSWNWLHLLRGVQTVHISLLKYGRDVNPTIRQDMMPELFSFAQQPTGQQLEISEKSQRILQFISATKTERFDALHSALTDGTFTFYNQDSPSLAKSAALAAIKSLGRVTDHICAWEQVNSLFRALVSWPGDLSPDFIQSLTGSNTSALTIYTHWLMLVTLAEDLWWVGDMGSSGIETILALVPQTDLEMQKVLQRPRQLLNMLITDY